MHDRKDTSTEGGSYVQGDASTGGGAFTGRDYQKFEGGVILNFDDPRDQHAVITEKTLRELVDNVKRLIIVIDGDVNYDSPGMRAKVKELDMARVERATQVRLLERRIDGLATWNRAQLAVIAILATVDFWLILAR